MILLTEATGHVGRAVVCRLTSLGHDVVAMVRDVQAASRRLPSGIVLRAADYEDASALKRALAGIDNMLAMATQAQSFPSSSNLRESGRLHSRLAVPRAAPLLNRHP
jgi:NAD(P)H dehydrogenase (quinone)